jgi:allophanate hydrolase subunit 2
MLIVDRVGPLCTVQDRGRFGHARHGVPASGPLDREAFAAALAAVGGRDDDAAIELPLSSARFLVEREVLCSIDGEPPRVVHDAIEVPACERAVRYLAVRGGVAMSSVLGSRATLPIAGFGRVLKRGDRIPIGEGGVAPRIGRHVALDDEPLTIIPTFDAVAVDAIVAASFIIDARSDRTGVRLRGAPLPAPTGERLSRPLVPGAIQLPPDGQPIVIGPDGPTTGGYPLIGVLDTHSRDRLARRRPGSTVRFAIAGNSR